MKNIFFFGTGFCAEIFVNKVKRSLKILGDFHVSGFLDNNRNKIGTTFEGYPVYSPDILREYPCDLVLLFLFEEYNYENVYRQLAAILPPGVIEPYYFPLKLLLQKRYENSTNTEIRETLNYISNHKMSVFNQFIQSPYTYDEVKWDSHINLPYIDFTTVDGKTVPMYYPPEYNFIKKENSIFVENLMWEQSPGSPHRYVKQDHDVNVGDCVIDAGVCEGNFALKYVNIVSHIYLFEMDPVWRKPLEYTFRDYRDKVTFINKALSDKTTFHTCRIDDIVSDQKVDFIKMDIEGAELSAIRGGEQVFHKNCIRSSICSYHRYGDEEKIRKQLEKYGYNTSVSDGYMCFLYADDIWETGDLRRGVVYGNKGQE